MLRMSSAAEHLRKARLITEPLRGGGVPTLPSIISASALPEICINMMNGPFGAGSQLDSGDPHARTVLDQQCQAAIRIALKLLKASVN